MGREKKGKGRMEVKKEKKTKGGKGARGKVCQG
jgi:hypothetical protein